MNRRAFGTLVERGENPPEERIYASPIRSPVGSVLRTAESPGVHQRLDLALERGALESGCPSLAVGDVHGLVVAHRLPPGHEPQLAAALAAAIVGVANTVARELRLGRVSRVAVECDAGSVLCLPAGPDAVLVGLCVAGADAAAARERLARVAREVAAVLAEV